MYRSDDKEFKGPGAVPIVGFRDVIDALTTAIERLPSKRDARHPEKDPIIEPHYKLASIVDKLVGSDKIHVVEAQGILKATSYSSKVVDVATDYDWERYILAVLKALRSADKSNWQHRLEARAAHVVYETDPHDPSSISGAKHELTQQIFTKTMAVQVWKPDNERSGRHFVYTGRYVRFFVQLLCKTDDRENLEMLARRIRKKAGEFIDHTTLWHEIAGAYLKVSTNASLRSNN